MSCSGRCGSTAAVDAALADGRGVILAGPRIGGWEVVVPVPTAARDVPVAVVVNDDWLA
jgi:predicted LPLAT superfamily acyltransferase